MKLRIITAQFPTITVGIDPESKEEEQFLKLFEGHPKSIIHIWRLEIDFQKGQDGFQGMADFKIELKNGNRSGKEVIP